MIGTVIAGAADVSGSVKLIGAPARTGSSGILVYLVPADRQLMKLATPKAKRGPYRSVQKNQMFSPHFLVVPVGAEVEFPNEDRVFHNVFSVYENTRFDLGLYEVGSTKKVRFTHPGVSFIFCNIHPQMSAVVFAVDTPFYALSDAGGGFRVTNVPDGQYELKVWSERAREDHLNQSQRTIQVKGDTAIPMITIEGAPSLTQGHKNKFGKDYDVPVPTAYPQ